MRLALRVVPLLLVLSSLAALFFARGAETLPLYAAREGLMCQTCHFDPNGGGPRNDFGFAYARNRHAVAPDPDSTYEFGNLELTNRVGDQFPLYFGMNQRFMLLTNSSVEEDSLDRLGFFNMENTLQVAFQPHRRLALVYSADAGFVDVFRTREAFGMLTELPAGGYLKAGRIRVPFGMRMDDHTVATRNGFLDFQTGERFLPFDPRNPDNGLEVGGTAGNFFGRAAWTNGRTHPLFGSTNTKAQAFAVRLGHNLPWYQANLSFYDEYSRDQDPVRATRWGYAGLAHWQQLAFLYEVAAGTDEAVITGDKTNRLAGFAEVDWHPNRALNFRVRYDRLELNRASDETIREANNWNRYAVEGEWVPVPFAEMRWVLRYIDAVSESAEDERQAYLQFHFSY